MYIQFPYNTTLSHARYKDNVLTIGFKKKGSIQERNYNTNSSIMCKLMKCTSAMQVLTIFSNEIKGKLQVITVKEHKK